jgi:hypothetical protein
MGQQLMNRRLILLKLAALTFLVLAVFDVSKTLAAGLGSENVLSRDTQPVFSPEMKQQLQDRQRPTAQMTAEGKLSPGTWTVKILENRVLAGHNPVNTAQPLYNFTLNGVTYTFDKTQVADPALLLKTAVTIQTKGAGSLNMNDPDTLAAVKQLQQMSNGTLSIVSEKPAPGPGPGPGPGPVPEPPVACTPAIYPLDANVGTWIFIDIGGLPGSCSVVSNPAGNLIIGIQNTDVSCTDAGMKVFVDVIGGTVTQGVGFTTYNGMCGNGLPAVEASSFDNQFILQANNARYQITFSVGNGGLQPMPYNHRGRYNSLTVSNVSVRKLP